MLDNFIVNIRTILPRAKTQPNENRDDKLCRKYTNESAMAFLEHSSKRDDAIFNENTNRTMLNAVRSYFSQLYQKRPASDVADDIMLPRVYNYSDLHDDWDPVELKVKEKLIEDIDNVIDKFVRVISVNETDSPRRIDLFYVHTLFTFLFQLFERISHCFEIKNFVQFESDFEWSYIL